MMKEALKKQYFCEKLMLESCGYHSVVTFDEWLEFRKNNHKSMIIK